MRAHIGQETHVTRGADPRWPEVGDTIAGYRLQMQLGEGGMGVVWSAEQLALSRRAALKVIRPEYAADDDFRRRFQSEARSAAGLDHPNIVTVLDAGEDNGALFMAMTLVDGSDLRSELTSGGPLDPERAVRVIEQVASGLDTAHDAGLVHRDVKPANILLGRNDHRALITDFGIAKALDASNATKSGVLLGTLDYLAPEQITGTAIDARTDVYALGAVLYEALTGEVPFARDNAPARMWAHINEPPPRPSNHPGVPTEFDAVVAIAMAKSPDDRYSTTGELALAARRALDRGVTTVPVTRETAVTSMAERSAPTRVEARSPLPPRGSRAAAASAAVKPEKRGRGLGTLALSLGLVAILAVGALAAVALTRSSSSGPARQPVATVTQRDRTVTTVQETVTTGPETSQTSVSAPSPGSSDGWPGGAGYTAVLASMPSRAGARTMQERAEDRGLEAGVLHSSDYGSLNPGYWVVFSGVFSDRASAAARVRSARTRDFRDAYARWVEP